MSPTDLAKRLQAFLVRWLRRTIPDLQGVRIDGDGTVSAKDRLGWRAVGHVSDYLPLARALGALPFRN